MPPVQAQNDQFQPAHPMVAAAQVGQLVGQERLLLLLAQARPQSRRQQQPRPAAQRQQQGRYGSREEPYGGTAPQAHTPGQVLHSLHDFRRRRAGTAQQAPEAPQAPAGHQPPYRGTRQPADGNRPPPVRSWIPQAVTTGGGRGKKGRRALLIGRQDLDRCGHGRCLLGARQIQGVKGRGHELEQHEQPESVRQGRPAQARAQRRHQRQQRRRQRVFQAEPQQRVHGRLL
jgi:hypothetical protein